MQRIKSNSRHFLYFIAILTAATMLRITHLGAQSEWNDEAISAIIASSSVEKILGNQFQSLHPPAYYLLLHYWQNLFGNSDFALRSFSALIGIGGIVAIYILGAILFKANTGLWAAVITALMPFHLFYSQEMRMYSLLFLLSTLIILCQTIIWRCQKNIWWIIYFLLSLLGLYTHYFFILLTSTMGLYFILRRRQLVDGPSWLKFFAVHAAIGVFYTPIILFWIPDLLSQSQDYWIEKVNLAGVLLSIPLAFTTGQFLDSGTLYASYALILTLLFITVIQTLRSFWKRSPDAPALALVLMVFLLPVLILLVVSALWTPLTQTRLMLVAVPGLYLLLAWGASAPKEKIVNIILLVLLIFTGLLADYNWLFNPNYRKPDARKAALLLRELASPQEIIVYANDSGFRLFSRYAPELNRRLFYEHNTAIRQVNPEVIRSMDGDIIFFEDPLPKTFWLVLYQDFNAGRQREVLERFNNRYFRLQHITIDGIRMYQYANQK